MRRPPLIALVTVPAVAGAGLTLALSAGSLDGEEVRHLAIVLVISVVVTVIATAMVARRLARSSMRVRLVAIALFATLVGLANLAVLSWLMLVGKHDAAAIAILVVYATAAAVGAALATARESADAFDRLAATAGRLAEGDLSARAGEVGGGPEISSLAEAMDAMADRLGRSIERERAAESQRRDLITAVSHDLRTPLSGLRAMIEAIDDGVVSDSGTIDRYVTEMRGSVESLVVLIDDLFELVQVDAGVIETESERARVGDVVRSALSACDAQATEKGLVLQARLDGAGAARCSPRLTRVVQNLLQNAIRHTPPDGTVVVEARHGPAGIEVSVADSGEGIEPEAIDRIFEPFWSGDSARTGDGAGLGLALAKRIVEALGGTIVVDSVPYRGSRFAIRLPDAG